MTEKRNVVDIKSFKFLKEAGVTGKTVKVVRKTKEWSDLYIEVRWIEYLEDEPVEKVALYSEADLLHDLTRDGKKIFTEKVFYALGDLMNTDPYYARELQERLEVLYDLGKDK